MGSFVAEEVHAVHFHTSVCGSVSPVSSPRALMQLISEPVNIFCFKLGCLFLCLEKKKKVTGKCNFSLVMFWPS